MRFIIICILPHLLNALPMGPEIPLGQAEFNANNNELQIVASDGAIIHWDQFSIGQDETVRFFQPNIDAVAINRVIGAEQSFIDGSLFANGKIVLINPSGILFGAESKIDLSSLLAASLDIQEQVFLEKGKLVFSENGGDINLQGFIHGGDVIFVARDIFASNTAKVVAREIALGSDLYPKPRWIEMAPGAVFDASGTSGSAGSVTLFAEKGVHFYGTILARADFRGDGGFVEVSSKETLIIEGKVDTSAPFGKTGHFLIDPTNVTIGTGLDMNTSGGPGYAFTGPNVNINNGMLSGFLAANNITIDTSSSNFGQVGTLTVTGAVTWSSGNSLTLISDGLMSIQESIQNAGTGALTLTSRTAGITLSGAAGVNVHVGVQNGPTTITCPLDLTLQGGLNSASQIGFRTAVPGPTTCTNAPITVNCRNVSAIGGNTTGGVQIGHGVPDVTLNNTFNTVNCPINVTASGNILLQGGRNASIASIGHSSIMVGLSAGALPNLDGNITVIAGGNLTMTAGTAPNSADNHAVIGHGCMDPVASGILGTVSGAITIRVNGNITLTTLAGSNDNRVFIGHHNHNADPSSVFTNVTGDVTISCCGNWTAVGNGTTNHILVGHTAVEGVIGAYTSNLSVSVGGNLTSTHSNNSQMAFGLSRFGAPTFEPNITGYVALVVGNNLTINTALTTQRVAVVGYQTLNVSSNPPTYVVAGNDIFLNNNGDYDLVIGGFGNVFVAAGGNIHLISPITGPAVAPFRVTAIGSTRINSATSPPAPLTRIFARGSIIARNQTTNPAGRLSESQLGWTSSTAGTVAVANRGFSADIRAGGDLQLATGIQTAMNGFLFLEADAVFTPGLLWTYAGSTLTSVTSEPLPVGVAMPACLNSAAFTTSPAVAANGIGGLRAERNPATSPTTILLQTAAGNITLHSSSLRADTNGLQNLQVGQSSSTDIGITTTSGNIEIWGSTPGNGFANITFDHPNTMMNTSGSILAVANQNITLAANRGLTSTAGPVTLVVDNAFPSPPLFGPGFFIANDLSFINAAQTIRIFTSQQHLNLISASALFNGTAFSMGPLFENSQFEVWCTYFNTPIQGVPFTIFYKDCLQEITQQASVVTTEFLEDLHPYDAYPGWIMRFEIGYAPKFFADLNPFPSTPYRLGRKKINLLNSPKSNNSFHSE